MQGVFKFIIKDDYNFASLVKMERKKYVTNN